MLVISIYFLLACLVYFFIYSLVISNIPYDKELFDLTDSKKTFYTALIIFSVLWIITIPIMIYNNIKS